MRKFMIFIGLMILVGGIISAENNASIETSEDNTTKDIKIDFNKLMKVTNKTFRIKSVENSSLKKIYKVSLYSVPKNEGRGVKFSNDEVSYISKAIFASNDEVCFNSDDIIKITLYDIKDKILESRMRNKCISMKVMNNGFKLILENEEAEELFIYIDNN